MSLAPSELDALPTQDKEWEGAQKPVPKGVYPCFLTMTTQEKFGCKENEDVTLAKPYVFITKQFFLDDIQFRGVISDFHPCKKKIEKYETRLRAKTEEPATEASSSWLRTPAWASLGPAELDDRPLSAEV